MNEKFILTGGAFLQGTVNIGASKNSVLALMAAAALGKEDVLLTNIPQNNDIRNMAEILRSIGVKVVLDKGGALINGGALFFHSPPYEMMRKIRASIYVAGVLLGRLQAAEVSLPGGDEIGSRPVDLHIRGFETLGAEVNIEHGLMSCKTRGLKGANYYINRSSVGVTVNMMLAAVLADGITILENPAKEPEIVDTAILLNSMGARIRGAGTDTMRIEGQPNLHGCAHTPIPDRIEAGTFLIAAAAIGGRVRITNVLADHLKIPIAKLREAGAEINDGDGDLEIKRNRRLKAVDVSTAVYPGFATDLQPPFGVMLSQAEGAGIIRETVFENRFRYLDELRRMGADIKFERDAAIIRGINRLSGAPVEATDIRAGAALVIAGLMAEGVTEISGINHIDRGYERFEVKLAALGAKIERR